MRRRDFVGRAARTAAVGLGGFLGPTQSTAEGQVSGPESEQVGEIYQLQAAFHRAKSTQDINLMMSLWHPDGILNIQGDPNSPYIGFDRLISFWLNSGSFTHRRFSLVPSFKIQIEVHGRRAWLYSNVTMSGTSICRPGSSRQIPSWPAPCRECATGGSSGR